MNITNKFVLIILFKTIVDNIIILFPVAPASLKL